MKRILLNQNKFTTVDDEDFGYLNQWHWYIGHNGYAIRRDIHHNKKDKRKTFHIHRLVLNTPDGFFTDHINGDKLDNRKENLRIADKTQNNFNRGIPKNNTSGYKGVSWDRLRQKWEVSTTVRGKKIHLGRFDSKRDAALAYNQAALKYHNEFARLNIL